MPTCSGISGSTFTKYVRSRKYCDQDDYCGGYSSADDTFDYDKCHDCKSASYRGAGIADTDFLLFVTAKHRSDLCAGPGEAGTVAYASACQVDQQGRPIVACVSTCPSCNACRCVGPGP